MPGSRARGAGEIFVSFVRILCGGLPHSVVKDGGEHGDSHDGEVRLAAAGNAAAGVSVVLARPFSPPATEAVEAEVAASFEATLPIQELETTPQACPADGERCPFPPMRCVCVVHWVEGSCLAGRGQQTPRRGADGGRALVDAMTSC